MSFIYSIIGALLNVASTFVGRILLAIGVSVSSFLGIDTGLAWLRDQAFAQMDMLPPQILALFSQLRIGTCISIISSAYLLRMVFSGASSGIFHRLIIKDL